jgi:hypothetical protein
LKKKFVKETQSEYVKNYKSIAMTEYTKSIFNMFYQTLWLNGIAKEKPKKDTINGVEKWFDIKENGIVNMNFKYENTPLSFEISPKWEIYMTNYLARKNQAPDAMEKKFDGTFQLKKTKLNNFFSFVGLDEMMKWWKLDAKTMLDSQKSMQDIVQEQVKSKLAQNHSLWNKELMRTEINYEMKRQSLAHKLLSLYKPPVSKDYLNWNKWEITEQQKWAFQLLNRYDQSIRTNKQADVVLERFFTNEKVNSLLKNMKWKEITTAELFTKLRFTNSTDLNLSKINKFTKEISKVSSLDDLKKLPEVEDYSWTYKNGKVSIKKQKAEDILSRLDNKVEVQ